MTSTVPSIVSETFETFSNGERSCKRTSRNPTRIPARPVCNSQTHHHFTHRHAITILISILLSTRQHCDAFAITRLRDSARRYPRSHQITRQSTCIGVLRQQDYSLPPKPFQKRRDTLASSSNESPKALNSPAISSLRLPITDKTPTPPLDPTTNDSSKEAVTRTKSPSFAKNLQGLSKFHQSILSRNCNRQRFVTGRYPLQVTIYENPTRKWLRLGNTGSDMAETEILVNGTAPLRSLASFDRFQWLDDSERHELVDKYNMVSLELLAEIHTERPGYLHVLPGDGAGSTASSTREQNQDDGMGWTNRWKQRTNSLLQEQLDSLAFDFRDRLWVTGFSLAGRKGLLKSVESPCGTMTSVTPRTARSLLWPNEVNVVPRSVIPHDFTRDAETYQNITASEGDVRHRQPFQSGSFNQDALLVCDGFLVPGKDRGGIYLIKNPGSTHSEWTVSLTRQSSNSNRWFYHRAVWVDLTGDGRKSILTSRCKVSTVLAKNDNQLDVTTGITKNGQLVWLECPKPSSFDPETGTPLESDGTIFDPFSAKHTPWKEHVLATGPDVMFCVADLDPSDDTVEIISSQFFSKKVTLHSISRGSTPHITFERTIDERSGSAFGCVLTNLDGKASPDSSFARVIDSGSTVATTKPGDLFTHLLVTSHECSYAANGKPGTSPGSAYTAEDDQRVASQREIDGGSLFAYRVPRGKGAWKTEPWSRTVIASGFKVNGQLGNMINPGAPGFVYTFYAKKSDKRMSRRPLIAVAGDCAESAYLFRPSSLEEDDQLEIPESRGPSDSATKYKLMVEMKCGATVGSIGIGYDDFTATEQEEGYAKLFIPCYEKDKILVFALGSGEEDTGGW